MTKHLICSLKYQNRFRILQSGDFQEESAISTSKWQKYNLLTWCIVHICMGSLNSLDPISQSTREQCSPKTASIHWGRAYGHSSISALWTATTFFRLKVLDISNCRYETFYSAYCFVFSTIYCQHIVMFNTLDREDWAKCFHPLTRVLSAKTICLKGTWWFEIIFVQKNLASVSLNEVK